MSFAKTHPGRWIQTRLSNPEALMAMLTGQAGEKFAQVADLIEALDARVAELELKAAKYDELMEDAGMAWMNSWDKDRA